MSLLLKQAAEGEVAIQFLQTFLDLQGSTALTWFCFSGVFLPFLRAQRGEESSAEPLCRTTVEVLEAFMRMSFLDGRETLEASDRKSCFPFCWVFVWNSSRKDFESDHISHGNCAFLKQTASFFHKEQVF